VTRAYVGIGANLGDAAATVRGAFGELDALPHTRVVKQSSLWRTAPVGHADQPDYVNAVAQIETGLPAGRLLDELLAVERRHGRERSFANAPRTLDLDILSFGDLAMNGPALTLPHPRMFDRAFVLQPLLEVAPDFPGAAVALARRCAGQRAERIA
jgi:2-amino-4-hydroxy-6-hydroxymethyldihydropteridine diphosphokinase